MDRDVNTHNIMFMSFICRSEVKEIFFLLSDVPEPGSSIGVSPDLRSTRMGAAISLFLEKFLAIHLMKYINESTGYFARRYNSPSRRILKAAPAASKSFSRIAMKRDIYAIYALECNPPPPSLSPYKLDEFALTMCPYCTGYIRLARDLLF